VRKQLSLQCGTNSLRASLNDRIPVLAEKDFESWLSGEAGSNCLDLPPCRNALENHVQQGTVNFDAAVVVNKTQSVRIAGWASCGNLADIPQMTPNLLE
jgi:hypothetical protein